MGHTRTVNTDGAVQTPVRNVHLPGDPAELTTSHKVCRTGTRTRAIGQGRPELKHPQELLQLVPLADPLGHAAEVLRNDLDELGHLQAWPWRGESWGM